MWLQFSRSWARALTGLTCLNHNKECPPDLNRKRAGTSRVTPYDSGTGQPSLSSTTAANTFADIWLSWCCVEMWLLTYSQLCDLWHHTVSRHLTHKAHVLRSCPIWDASLVLLIPQLLDRRQGVERAFCVQQLRNGQDHFGPRWHQPAIASCTDDSSGLRSRPQTISLNLRVKQCILEARQTERQKIVDDVS